MGKPAVSVLLSLVLLSMIPSKVSSLSRAKHDIDIRTNVGSKRTTSQYDDNRYLSDTATTPPDEICDLDCQNGGNCEIVTQALDHNNVAPKICVCPPGYGGLSCQITTSVCFVYLNQDRYCRNAAPCVTRGGAHCNCDHAHDIGAFGGIECEYPATEYCTDDGSISWAAFCTNGGDCGGYVKNATELHPGCACREGFEGNHCEYLHGTQPVPLSTNPHKAMKITLILFFGLSLSLLVCIIRSWHRRKFLARNAPKHEAGVVPTNLDHVQMG